LHLVDVCDQHRQFWRVVERALPLSSHRVSNRHFILFESDTPTCSKPGLRLGLILTFWFSSGGECRPWRWDYRGIVLEPEPY